MKSTPMALALALLTMAAVLPAQPEARPAPPAPVQPQTVEFPAPDGLVITGDLYALKDKARPFVLLCHQARSSRGEYRKIAPGLVSAGFNCLAIDQRSGRGLPDVSGNVPNQTAVRARKEGRAVSYGDAEQDIVAAARWIRKQGYSGKLTLWGSSYSASLAIVIASKVKDVEAVIAFSPGEYLRPRGAVATAAAQLKIPVLIVAPQDEKQQADAIFEACASKQRILHLSPDNMHGSRTLFLAENSKPAWDAVRNFLRRHARGPRRQKPAK